MVAYVEKYGTVNTASNGKEALAAIAAAHVSGELFDIVFLDVMMPEMDGHVVLKGIRSLEVCYSVNELSRTKVVMTTALDDFKNVSNAYNGLCDGYLVKPLRRDRVLEELRNLGLISR
jgi:two-component system chemotaxis response regulator CheY